MEEVELEELLILLEELKEDVLDLTHGIANLLSLDIVVWEEMELQCFLVEQL